MANILESFFDENIADYKLWTKDPTHIDPTKEKLLLAETLFKFSKKSNKWKARHFVLTPKNLIYYKVGSADPGSL